MSNLSSSTISGAQRVLLLHALAVALATLMGVAGAATLLRSERSLLSFAACGLLAAGLVFVLWKLRRLLRAGEVFERLLTRLSTDTTGYGELPQIALNSPAADGWNRLAVFARRWFDMQELQKSVAKGLSASAGGSASTLIDSLPDGVAATDAAGKIESTNPAFLSMFSAGKAEEVVGQSFVDICAPPQQEREQIAQAPVGKRLAIEFSNQAPDGAAHTIRLVRAPRVGDQGVTAGHVWLARDVSQQRLAEEMRDKFLATATHELRTPLANLSAYAETLTTMDDLDAESQKDFYNIIQSEAHRLSQLIDDLLDVSRMQAGAMAIDCGETDLGRLVDEVTRKVEATMLNKDIEFACEFPPKFPKINADKSKLAASLVNLIGNAAKYTPEGGKVTFRVDIGERRAEFSVADTGIGIAPEELPNVFDRFFRSDDQRVRDIPGSGLGLSLTQEVARLHGGDLTVESELNVGSIFKLTLPIENAE